MATNLNDIIDAISEVALANNFVSVEQFKLNLDSNADTLLPKLFIRLTGIDYSEFLVDSSLEDYKIDLIIIQGCTENPISTLKAKMDLLINKLVTTNQLFANLARAQKIELVEADLTNERDLYSKFGGEGVTLSMKIKNINNFGVASC